MKLGFKEKILPSGRSIVCPTNRDTGEYLQDVCDCSVTSSAGLVTQMTLTVNVMPEGKNEQEHGEVSAPTHVKPKEPQEVPVDPCGDCAGWTDNCYCADKDDYTDAMVELRLKNDGVKT